VSVCFNNNNNNIKKKKKFYTTIVSLVCSYHCCCSCEIAIQLNDGHYVCFSWQIKQKQVVQSAATPAATAAAAAEQPGQTVTPEPAKVGKTVFPFSLLLPSSLSNNQTTSRQPFTKSTKYNKNKTNEI